ncbi:CLUMA_CG020088, isoform A [Clunio marinus]|uniref:glutathione transferase n=1 Tax=Clunio marinus TaxID=568069 RepID=A0A1J1J855_9DIPT|nr:CLUMA_CG020088, isoform A [Clunio marinus]
MCDLYYTPLSPPCRSVLMLGKALGIRMHLKAMDMAEKKDHMTPEFLKLNPQHTIPTLVDNGFSLWESRAILGYLVDKYAKNDSLYPKDPKKRAVVDQRLYFDMGTLYKRLGDYYFPQMRMNLPADPENFKKLEEAVELLDLFLSKSKYVAGDKATIADYALISTFSTLEAAEYDFSRFHNIIQWYDLCKKTLAGIEANEEGIRLVKERLEKMKAKN